MSIAAPFFSATPFHLFLSKLDIHRAKQSGAIKPKILSQTGMARLPTVISIFKISLDRCITETNKNIIAQILKARSFMVASSSGLFLY